MNRSTDKKIKELIEKSKSCIEIGVMNGVFEAWIHDCFKIEGEHFYPHGIGIGPTLDEAIMDFINKNEGEQLCVHPYCSDEHRFTI